MIVPNSDRKLAMGYLVKLHSPRMHGNLGGEGAFAHDTVPGAAPAPHAGHATYLGAPCGTGFADNVPAQFGVSYSPLQGI